MDNTPFARTGLLTLKQQLVLARFFRRAADLYVSGVISCESLIDYLKLVSDALDPDRPGSVNDLPAVLGDAWREADG